MMKRALRVPETLRSDLPDRDTIGALTKAASNYARPERENHI